MHTAIFDIGKTNKKFFLFDEQYQQVFKGYTTFEEIMDEDGHPTDDLVAIRRWLQELFDQIIASEEYDIGTLNFSTYGASFVHLDVDGIPLTPLYNYTKPFPEELRQQFYRTYGPPEAFCRATGSPDLGMLNSGLQLYWLKHRRPKIYERVRYSLHFPQYLSYLFTGIPVSEYTSIGCHTGLWDYERGDYHRWVYAEGIDQKLAPVVATETSINMSYEGRPMKVGVGIHDSSAALLPYLRADHKPFLLISTGTWSIALNPRGRDVLSRADLAHDTLHYMRTDGCAVRATRLFMGHEYKTQIQQLNHRYDKPHGYHRTVRFDERLYHRLQTGYRPRFRFDSIALARPAAPVTTDLDGLESFEVAFHQLMLELIELQVAQVKRAMANTPINKIYIDGGFADNDMYVQLMAYHFPEQKLRTIATPLGSALGAALAVNPEPIKRKFLRKNYGLRKHKPPILDT